MFIVILILMAFLSFNVFMSLILSFPPLFISIEWQDLLLLKLHKRSPRFGVSFKRNGNLLLKPTQTLSMANGLEGGKDLTCLVRIGEVQVVVQVVPWKHLHLALQMINFPAVTCHGKIFTQQLLDGDRFPSLVTLLCG